MDWKEQLAILEHTKQWDNAIDFMKIVVKDNPDDIDAYLFMNYLLINLLVEEEYNFAKNHDYYAQLAKHYFDESNAKFSENPAYLYYSARMAVMSPWYFNIDSNDIENMMQKAMKLAPDNLVYKWRYYFDLEDNYSQNKDEIVTYSKLILSEDSLIQKELKTKGALGEYILNMMTNWAKRMIFDKGKWPWEIKS